MEAIGVEEYVFLCGRGVLGLSASLFFTVLSSEMSWINEWQNAKFQNKVEIVLLSRQLCLGWGLLVYLLFCVFSFLPQPPKSSPRSDTGADLLIPQLSAHCLASLEAWMFEELNSLSLLLSPWGEKSVVPKDMTSQLSHSCTERCAFVLKY